MRPLPMHRFHRHLQRRLPVSVDLSNVRISLSFHTFGHRLNLIFQTFPIRAVSIRPCIFQKSQFSIRKHHFGTTANAKFFKSMKSANFQMFAAIPNFTFDSEQLVPSSAGCEVHVYRSRWQCKSRQISFSGCALERIESLPYFNMHCWSASKRSPGWIISAPWSSAGSDWPWSNKHFAWLVLISNANEKHFTVIKCEANGIQWCSVQHLL